MTEDAFDVLAWQHAESLLQEARLVSADGSPGMLAHAAYYVMFHCARACLLRVHGQAPKKHDSVLNQFGMLVKDRGEVLRRAGRDLNNVRSLRIVADYSDQQFIYPAEARQAMQLACALMDIYATEFAFLTLRPAPVIDEGSSGPA